MTFRCLIRDRVGNRYGVEFMKENNEDSRNAAELREKLAGPTKPSFVAVSCRWHSQVSYPLIHELSSMLLNHLNGILSSCQIKVPLGVVEAIDENIKAAVAL